MCVCESVVFPPGGLNTHSGVPSVSVDDSSVCVDVYSHRGCVHGGNMTNRSPKGQGTTIK